MKERFVPIRPGIAEHLLRGDISAFEFGVYVIIHCQTDYRTGIWRGSAARILNSAPRGAKLREIQRAIKHLTELGLLRHFHKHGQRGNFPFLINKFTVRSGALTGMRLNADRSESWQSPAYEFCVDADADNSADVRAQDAAIQEVRIKKEKEKSTCAEGRFEHSRPSHAEFDCFWQAYPRSLGMQDAKRAWVKQGCEGRLGEVLASLEAWKATQQWSDSQYIPFPATWLKKGLWKDMPQREPPYVVFGPNLTAQARELEARLTKQEQANAIGR